MAQPSQEPRWADTTAVNITEPASGLKDVGYVTSDVPTAQNHNWLFNRIYQWIVYLKNLTSEILTWTGAQTFEGGAIFNMLSGSGSPAAEVTADNRSSSIPEAFVIGQGGYTGAGTGTQVSPAVLVTGGAGGTADGGVALRGLGGTGATSGKGGTGLQGDGRDGSVWNGTGVLARGGDLTGTGGTSLLRAAATVRGGSAYTNTGKTTYGTPNDVEHTFTIEASRYGTSTDATAAGGMRVVNPAGLVKYAFEGAFTQYGFDFDAGQYMRLRPETLANIPAHNFQGDPGCFNHMSMAAVCASLRITGVSGTSISAPSITGDSIGLASSPISLTNLNRVRIAFDKPFVNNGYVVQASASCDSKILLCTVWGAPASKNVDWVELIFFDVVAAASHDLRVNSQITDIDICVYGRQVP